MKNIDDISEKVEKRKKQLEPLFTKDKENYDLWAGAEQKFDTHKMAINITGTEMTEKSRKVQASINRARLDIHVLPPGRLPNQDAIDQANQEERMYYYGLEQADDELLRIGEAKLKTRAAWQITNLGRAVVQVLVYKRKGEIIWRIRPLNPRFVVFWFDSTGLAGYAYETFRSPLAIKEEYDIDVTEESEGKGISVTDYWDKEHNVRYLTKSKEALKQKIKIRGKEQSVEAWEHPFKEVPAIVIPVAMGPMAISSEGTDVTMWGQSIFDHVKVPFKNLNLMRSVMATHAHMLAKKPIEEIYEDGTEPNIEEEHLDFHAGALIKHPKSIELKSMDIADIPASLPTIMADIKSGIDRATYTELSPDVSAHSGAALRILGQERHDFQSPREEAMASMYTQICRMLKRQILTQKLTIPVQTVVNGVYETYKMEPSLLKNDFYVGAELIRRDAYDEVESLQMAQMLKQNGWASDEYIMEHILKMQDVPAEMFKIKLERIKAVIPELDIKDMVKILREDKQQPEDADILEKQLAMIELQKMQSLGGMPQPGMPTGGATPQGARTPPRRGVVPGVP